MPAPATITEFLDLLSRSRLLDSSAWNDCLASASAIQPLAELAAQFVRQGLLTDFQARQLLNGRCQGFVVGPYRLLDRLGAGAMSTVFLAEDERTKRRVALKVLLPTRAKDPACRSRFVREAKAVAALDHPNIVRAFDFDSDGTVDFLIMEHIEGVNLCEAVRHNGPLEPMRAADYVRQAALGLQHAHENGLVHRDVKPANLLVTPGGLIKILDLGLARFYQDETDQLTREHDGQALLGTADYLAPEQSRDSHDVDIRADVYSLGATFFYLLAGQPIFEGGTLNQKLIWHQMKPPPDVRAFRLDVPEELATLISKMLAKDPRQRPQTPQEVADELTLCAANRAFKCGVGA